MLARKSVFTFTADITNAILSYIALFFITKYMTPGAYGIIMFATGYVALIFVLGDLGFDSAHVKFISGGEKESKCVGIHLAVKTILIVLGSIGVFISILVWKFVLHQGFETQDEEIVIYIILASIAIKGLATPFQTTFAAKKEMVKNRVTMLGGTIARVIAIIYVALMGLGIMAFAFVYIAEAVATLILTSLLFFRKYTIERPTMTYFKMYLSFAVPIMWAQILATILSNINPVLIQFFYNSPDVGFYRAALQIIVVLALFTNAIGTLLFPTISEMHVNGNKEGIKDIITKSERFLSMIGVPLVLCTVALAIPIAEVILNGWTPVAIILQALAIYSLFSALEQPYTALVMGANKPVLMRNNLIITFIVDMVLNVIFIPSSLFGIPLLGLGGFGAALALTIAYGVGYFYCRTIAYKMLPKGAGSTSNSLKHIVAALIMAFAVYILAGYIPVMRWYWLIGLALIYFCGYLLILIGLREFKKEDFTLIQSAINVKQMFQYAVEEIKENKDNK